MKIKGKDWNFWLFLNKWIIIVKTIWGTFSHAIIKIIKSLASSSEPDVLSTQMVYDFSTIMWMEDWWGKI